MTCKDCIHYEVCSNNDVEETIYDVVECEIVEKNCEHFKDKSKFIELPCKVGDTVILLLEKLNGDFEMLQTFCMAHCKLLNYGEYWSMFVPNKEINNSLEFYKEDFGKTVFLNREEAEKALKEREK